jgi:uncharacterized protein YoxC
MLVAVTLVLVVAVALLIRTTTLASQIDGKAANIAKTGRGINTATDAILQLAQTNQLGDSILATAKPLVPTLDKVVAVAKSIDGLSASINSTADDVNGTAKGINATAGGILTTAQSINNGVESIDRNVDTLTLIVKSVKADTATIVGQGQLAAKLGSCIDSGLPAGSAADGHCK